MHRVLLVDDNEANRLTLSALLEIEGFAITQASSLTTARQALTTNQRFAIVLLDRQLGDGLGVELIPIIREQMPDSKIIVVSGGESEPPICDACDDYFGKGDDLDALLQKIHRFAYHA